MNRYGFPAGRMEFWKLAERLGIPGCKHGSTYRQYDAKFELEIAGRGK